MPVRARRVLSGANLNTLVKLCGFRLPHPLRQAWDSRRERIFNSLDEDKSHLRANIVGYAKFPSARFSEIAKLRAASTGAGSGSVAAVRAGLNVADGGGAQNPATNTTNASTPPGRPARFKSFSATSAQNEISFEISFERLIVALLFAAFNVIAVSSYKILLTLNE